MRSGENTCSINGGPPSSAADPPRQTPCLAARRSPKDARRSGETTIQSSAATPVWRSQMARRCTKSRPSNRRSHRAGWSSRCRPTSATQSPPLRRLALGIAGVAISRRGRAGRIDRGTPLKRGQQADERRQHVQVEGIWRPTSAVKRRRCGPWMAGIVACGEARQKRIAARCDRAPGSLGNDGKK